jgi:hypothetical protein
VKKSSTENSSQFFSAGAFSAYFVSGMAKILKYPWMDNRSRVSGHQQTESQNQQ